MKDSRKERTTKVIKNRKEFEKSRNIVSGMIWVGLLFAIIVAIFAGNMITIKNPERFNYYEEKTRSYAGETYTERVEREKNPNDFNWEIFFLTFCMSFAPFWAAGTAASAAIDCMASVVRDEEAEKMVYEDEKKKREAEEKKLAVMKSGQTILDELQKEEEELQAKNAMLDEISKDDDKA